MAGQPGPGAIELLGEHDASQLVRQRQWRKRQAQVSRLLPVRRYTFGSPAEKDDLADAAVALVGQPLRKLHGAERPAIGVEQDAHRSPLQPQAVERPG